MSKILCFEDDRAISEMFTRLFERIGHEVYCASDAASGLQLAEQIGPDIILMDILLPGGIDGWEAIEHLKSSALRNVPIIIVTAQNDTNVRQKADELGCWGVFPKPFMPNELVAFLRPLLS